MRTCSYNYIFCFFDFRVQVLPSDFTFRFRVQILRSGSASTQLSLSVEIVKGIVTTKRSGISRMTFYHYYDSKLTALTDYLHEIILHYLRESRKAKNIGKFQEYDHILFSLNFFDQYAEFFLVMKDAGLYSVLINGINEFMTAHFSSRFKNSIYGLYYYAGALLNTFLKWEEGGKREPAEEIAKIICRYALPQQTYL